MMAKQIVVEEEKEGDSGIEEDYSGEYEDEVEDESQ